MAGVRQEVVASTLRFVDRFPEHEHAAVVLGAAIDDLYDMKEFQRAIATGHRLIDAYPAADASVRRSAWAVIAHASLDTSGFAQAEAAYGRVLEMTPEADESRQAVIDNLAAAIYKQGEQAKLVGDYRAAADHFLRISQAAPTSEIRPAAQYDAGAALIQLEDWVEAVAVLDAFRQSYPEHGLYQEATKQIASIYREQGDLSRAAAEYERVAAEAEAPELRREALLVAGELYRDSGSTDRALAAYRSYVEQFPEPLELAVETRFKIAEIHDESGDGTSYHEQLERIVAIDAAASAERTPRIRYLAARSALLLTERLYHRFAEVKLIQPFEKHLQRKQRRMDEALAAFNELVDYEVGEVTAAATFYVAEIYFEFSAALMESERPADLSPAEMQDYELVLEEEAFPFEERAIDVHQKNLELMATGVYNPWIERSLAKLARLMPGRSTRTGRPPPFKPSRTSGSTTRGGSRRIRREPRIRTRRFGRARSPCTGTSRRDRPCGESTHNSSLRRYGSLPPCFSWRRCSPRRAPHREARAPRGWNGRRAASPSPRTSTWGSECARTSRMPCAC
jgi:outer membrane protein assembly factor BamD (BamD/ComL family)